MEEPRIAMFANAHSLSHAMLRGILTEVGMSLSMEASGPPNFDAVSIIRLLGPRAQIWLAMPLVKS